MAKVKVTTKSIRGGTAKVKVTTKSIRSGTANIIVHSVKNKKNRREK